PPARSSAATAISARTSGCGEDMGVLASEVASAPREWRARLHQRPTCSWRAGLRQHPEGSDAGRERASCCETMPWAGLVKRQRDRTGELPLLRARRRYGKEESHLRGNRWLVGVCAREGRGREGECVGS